jgi:hypothetical protein
MVTSTSCLLCRAQSASELPRILYFARPIRGGTLHNKILNRSGIPVIRISFPWMIEVVQSLDNLDSMQAGQKVLSTISSLFSVRNHLESTYTGSIYWHFLRTSRIHADKLARALDTILEAEPFDIERPLTQFEVWNIKNERDQFKIVFLADISMLPAYLVTKKENYDVDYLIDNGVGLFPGRLPAKAPETNRDVAEVGRCLAFERYTACGFHTFRVLEAVTRRYWDAVAGERPRPNPQTIGNLACQLKMNSLGDSKVFETLEPLAKHHRNPLAHHDVILDLDEAMQAIGVVRAAITLMLFVLPDVPTTTGAPAPSEGS